MATIGILGGMGPQASNKLCELLIDKALERSVSRKEADVPELVLLSVPVPNFVSNKNNLETARRILVNRVRLFAQANCDIAGISCNTAHLLLPDIQAASTVAFVNLPQLVANHITENKLQRVGLLASPSTLQSTLFDDAITDAVIVRPHNDLAMLIETSIHKKLEGTITEKETRNFKQSVLQFIEDKALDAVILGCTELPLVFGPSNDPRIINTLDVLADGLIQAADLPNGVSWETKPWNH
jgi:aspartate racemase